MATTTNVGIGGCVSPQPSSITETQQSQWIVGFLFLRSARRPNKINGLVSYVQITRNQLPSECSHLE
jgi:hypothetical protein